MNERVEIDLRNIVCKHTNALKFPKSTLEGLTIGEVIEFAELPEERIFNEEQFDRLIHELYLYIQKRNSVL